MPVTTLIVQPQNRGTRVAITTTVLTALESILTFLPCDHFYSDPAELAKSIGSGILAAQEHPDTLILLGAEPEYAETEYGWIEPLDEATVGRANSGVARVKQFWEKPQRIEGGGIAEERMSLEHFRPPSGGRALFSNCFAR